MCWGLNQSSRGQDRDGLHSYLIFVNLQRILNQRQKMWCRVTLWNFLDPFRDALARTPHFCLLPKIGFVCWQSRIHWVGWTTLPFRCNTLRRPTAKHIGPGCDWTNKMFIQLWRKQKTSMLDSNGLKKLWGTTGSPLLMLVIARLLPAKRRRSQG